MLGCAAPSSQPPCGVANRQRTVSPPWRTVRSAAMSAYTPSTQNTHHRPASAFAEPLIASIKTALYGGDQFDQRSPKWRFRAASTRKRKTVLFRVSVFAYEIVHPVPSMAMETAIPLERKGGWGRKDCAAARNPMAERAMMAAKSAAFTRSGRGMAPWPPSRDDRDDRRDRHDPDSHADPEHERRAGARARTPGAPE